MQKKINSLAAVLTTIMLVGAGCNNLITVTPRPTSDVVAQEQSKTNTEVRSGTEMNDGAQETEKSDDDAAATVGAMVAASSTTKVAVPPVVVQSSVKEFTMTAKNWEFSPSTITVKKGDTVRIKLTSVDVDHGFALPDFNVKVDLLPGKTVVVEFVADKVGTFSFRCSIPCGSGHREMIGKLIVQ